MRSPFLLILILSQYYTQASAAGPKKNITQSDENESKALVTLPSVEDLPVKSITGCVVVALMTLAYKLIENAALGALWTQVIIVANVLCCCQCRRRPTRVPALEHPEVIYADGSKICHLFSRCGVARRISSGNKNTPQTCTWCEKEYARVAKMQIQAEIDWALEQRV